MMKTVAFSVLAFCLINFVFCQEGNQISEHLRKYVEEKACSEDNAISQPARSCLNNNMPECIRKAMSDLSGNEDFEENIASLCSGSLTLENIENQLKENGDEIKEEDREKAAECLMDE